MTLDLWRLEFYSSMTRPSEDLLLSAAGQVDEPGAESADADHEVPHFSGAAIAAARSAGDTTVIIACVPPLAQ